MPSKRRTAHEQKLPATSLEEQERQLEEQRRKIREEMQQVEDFLKKAPAIKKEQELRKREELVQKRATRVPQVSRNRSALPDNRHIHIYNAEAPLQPQRSPRLRRERSQGRLTFFLLLFALLVVLGWAYSTFASR